MSLLQEYLIEQLLNETLEDAFGFYKDKLSREQFDKLIALDPTFKIEQDRLGTYGKWIIASFLRGTLKEEEFNNVTEILDDFNTRKRNIKAPGGSDINRYKTLAEIRAALDTVELTDTQKERLRRKAKQHAELGDQAEFLFETDKWEVWVPKTYAASMKLGSGSSWCTASTGERGERYFHQYTDQWGSQRRGSAGDCGNLVIFNNKQDSSEKYQLQVILDPQGKPYKIGDFMDISDSSADFEGFIAKENLIDELSKSRLKDLPEIQKGIIIKQILDSGQVTVKSAVNDVSRYGGGVNALLPDGSQLEIKGKTLKGSKLKELIVIGVGDDKTDTDFKENPFEVIRFFPKSTVTHIGSESFMNSKKLKTIILPLKLVSIGEHAFKGCENLEEVFLPDSVRYIGLGAFEGCNKLVLKMNKRKGKSNIQVPEADLAFLKQHLQVIDKQPTAEELEEAILQEVFSPSMPQWLQDWLKKNKANQTDGRRLRVKITGEENEFSRIPGGSIDLNKAEFLNVPVPTSPRDQYLKEPYLPIFYLEYDEDDIPAERIVYIPGVNDNKAVRWESERKEIGRMSKTAILQRTKKFTAIDTSKPENFSKDIQKEREVAKQGSVERKSAKEVDSYTFRTQYDKSGYRLDPEALIVKLKEYTKENFPAIIKKYYERLEALRKALHKILVKISIDNPRHDEEIIRRAHDKMFKAINIYRYIVAEVEKALKIKDKKQREYNLYRLFDLEERDYMSKKFTQDELNELDSYSPNYTFDNFKSNLKDAEHSYRRVNLTTLE
jgi:hypothetical protein